MTTPGIATIEQVADQARRAIGRAAAAAATGRMLFPAGLGLLTCALLTRVVSHWWAPASGIAVAVSLFGVAATMLAASAVVGAHRARVDRLSAAAEVDERLKLASRLSSALAFADSDDPFAQAAVADGVACASDPSLRQRMRGSFATTLPREARWGGAMVVAACLVSAAVPSWQPDTAEQSIDPALLTDLRAESNAKVEAIEQAILQNDDLAKALSDESGALTRDASEGLRSPEEIRRAAARRMTELNQRLEQVLASDQAQQLAAMERALASLAVPQDGAAKPLAEALKRGDFAEASRQLQELSDAAKSGELSTEARDKLAKQLEQLAAALEQAADRQQAMRDALADAGLDPDLASNPEALRQAMQAAKGLSKAQREALQSAMAAQQQASNAARDIAKACKSCAGGKPSDGAGQGQQGASQLASAGGKEALEEFARFDEMMAAARDAKGQCQGDGPAQLSPSDGDSDEQGPGMGGRGHGVGGEAEKQSTATGTRERRAKVENRGGEVIARQLIENPNPEAGDVTSRLREVSQDIARGVEGATPDDPVPPHLRDAHRKYFGELQRRIDKKVREAGGA